MIAELLPLEGKYYGTNIRVTMVSGEIVEIELGSSDEKPSQRELEDPEFEIYDGHYERDSTYRVAQAIVDAFEGTVIPKGW